MLHQIIFNLTLKPGNRLRRSPQEGDKYTGISEFGIRFPKLQSHLISTKLVLAAKLCRILPGVYNLGRRRADLRRVGSVCVLLAVASKQLAVIY